MPAALFRHDAVSGKVRAQAIHDQAFRGAIGLGHQVEIRLSARRGRAAQSSWRAGRRPRARFPTARLQIGGQPLSTFLERYLMSCLKMKRLGPSLRVRRMKDGIVVFNDAGHFLVIAELDPDRSLMLDQLFEVLGLLKRCFGGARPTFPPCLAVTLSPAVSAPGLRTPDAAVRHPDLPSESHNSRCAP